MQSIGQYTYRVGEAVAFLIDGIIRIGNVATIITKQDKDGERTAIQVHVHKVNPTAGEPDDEPERFLIPRGELIDNLPGAEDVYGTLKNLLLESPEYKTALAKQSAFFNPPPAVEARPPATEATPAVDAVPPITGGSGSEL